MMGGAGGGQLISFNRNSQSLCRALSSGGFYLYCSTFKRLKKPPPSSEMDEELYPHEKVFGDKPGSLRAGVGGGGERGGLKFGAHLEFPVCRSQGHGLSS